MKLITVGLGLIKAFFENQAAKMKKFEAIHYEKEVVRLRKAVDWAEKYIFEIEGKNRRSKIGKYKKQFFRYNS